MKQYHNNIIDILERWSDIKDIDKHAISMKIVGIRRSAKFTVLLDELSKLREEVNQ